MKTKDPFLIALIWKVVMYDSLHRADQPTYYSSRIDGLLLPHGS